MALEQFFPNLLGTGYSVTSPAISDYNCIAWAAGVTDEWWWPDPMGINPWPAAARREETIAAFIDLFQSLGYVLCPDASLEPGFEKVALYALAGLPKHAARQLPGGRWTSKLGPLADIEHALDGLVGTWYGNVVQTLKRPLTHSNRNRLLRKYSSTLSTAIHRRSTLPATAPVVFDPANGSSTIAPSSVSNLMKNSGSAAGKRAGWIIWPAAFAVQFSPLSAIPEPVPRAIEMEDRNGG